MRIYCYFCGTSVSTEVPEETILRAVAVCPECIEAERILIPESAGEPAEPPAPTE
ncbi:MAG TPA: hypothetical protein VIX41_03615 [Acidimicrobiales bacterium]